MFNKFFQLSDDQIKDLFDHFRNIGICSAIFAASDWQYSQIGPLNLGLSIFNAFIFSLLVAVGGMLLLIVLAQAFRKFQAYGLKDFNLKLIYGVYSLSIVSLIISIFVH
ncbi:hypothetical protein SAMN06295945_1793 [Polynucleobacter meluiroseus]|uniref:Uncharacterized protein n=1 Tax=Polynucleobacter meluiroseus TaxID=1938814 RepID=A0A240E4H2_9BURK|nr:hypothetical protein [Polynucleobacter meluiroseus]SNX29416.1 hypothetical protein SAMN06295945_1793 [Polynucleobacter meluiroseus]